MSIARIPHYRSKSSSCFSLHRLLEQFTGTYQETSGVKTGWGAVILAEVVALVAAGTVTEERPVAPFSACGQVLDY